MATLLHVQYVDIGDCSAQPHSSLNPSSDGHLADLAEQFTVFLKNTPVVTVEK